jgi:hypothetical protein
MKDEENVEQDGGETEKIITWMRRGYKVKEIG